MKKKTARLLPRQRLFAEEYIKHFNATRAARDAGYSKKTAGETGAENLKKPHIKEYIDKKIKETSIRNQISVDRILEEYARKGIANIESIFDEEGKLIGIKSLPRDVSAAIHSVKVRRESVGDGEFAVVEEYKMHDKHKALEKLAQYAEALLPQKKEQLADEDQGRLVIEVIGEMSENKGT